MRGLVLYFWLWLSRVLWYAFHAAARQVVAMAGTPVTFSWTQSIAAGATFNPLSDWQYETPDFNGMVEIFSRATATGVLLTVSSAGETLMQESPVQAGGTAGTTPSRLNTEPVVGRCAPNSKIRIGYRNPTAGAITVDGQIILSPAGGAGGGGRRRVRSFPVRRRRRPRSWR